MSSRREFLRVGAASLGFAATAGEGVEAQVSPPETASRVRMVGDGLGLRPADAARLWTRLATEQGIVADSYSIGGTVDELEQQFATMLGKERAVFMPTGTLANHLAVRTLAGREGRAIVQAESHLFNDSGDCVQTLSGITLLPLGHGRAGFTLDEVTSAIDRTESGRVATPISVISIESPVRRRYGETFDPMELERIVAFAKQEGIGLHLDGARLFLQSAYTGVSPATFAEPFDTVYVSLYKYFNAASGAILAGPRVLLDDMYHTRRMFGAGLPGAWPFASIAWHYASGFMERYRRAIDVSEDWVRQIARHTAFSVERIPSGTNIFRLRVSHSNLPAFRVALRAHGVDLSAPRPDGTGFLITVNETWNTITPEALVDRFVDALSA